jgi:hypothetical protein
MHGAHARACQQKRTRAFVGSIVFHREYLLRLFTEHAPIAANSYTGGADLWGNNHRRQKGVGVMALNLVAGVDLPSQLPTATAPYFLLGLNSSGAWVIRETTGRQGGLFTSPGAAIRYASEETPDGNFTILHCPNGLELELPQVRRAA